MRAAIVGATGYAGKALVIELQKRGHQAISVARAQPEVTSEGTEVIVGDFMTQYAEILSAAKPDAVILANRWDPASRDAFLLSMPDILATLQKLNARIGVIGGAGTLFVPRELARHMDMVGHVTNPEQAILQESILKKLYSLEDFTNWFYVSPPERFGKQFSHPSSGSYQRGSHEIMYASNGESFISADDFAIGLVDELETPRALGTRFALCAN